MHINNIIHAYTRSEAIADGLLIDASQLAKEAGFRYPLAMTRAAWETCVRVSTANLPGRNSPTNRALFLADFLARELLR